MYRATKHMTTQKLKLNGEVVYLNKLAHVIFGSLLSAGFGFALFASIYL